VYFPYGNLSILTPPVSYFNLPFGVHFFYPTSKVSWAAFLIGVLLLIPLLWSGLSSQVDNDRQILKDFFYNCMDTMPKNESYQFCVQSALGRKFKFDDVEAVLKQYVAEEQQKKDKK